jgi:hypothetical protein
MDVKYVNLFQSRALEIYPNWDFLFESKPSGNPVDNLKMFPTSSRHEVQASVSDYVQGLGAHVHGHPERRLPSAKLLHSKL